MKRIFSIALMCVSLFANAQTNLFPIEIKGKWGYMNRVGSMQIQAMYDYAEVFQEGFAVVALHNLPCVINEKAQRIVDTNVYQFIGKFSDGLAVVRDFKQQKFYINTKGEKVITLPSEIYEARKFRHGLACVSKQLDQHTLKFNHDIVTLGYGFGYIDKSGKQSIDFIYDDADDFDKYGLARVKIKTGFGLINTKGETVLKPDYANIGDFSEGKAVIDANGKYGYVDTNGQIVIAAKFDMAFEFNEGMAAILNISNKKYGFINEKGEIKIPLVYDDVRPFSEGRAAVLKDGKWGFIDKSGMFVINNQFDNASIFREGMCAVLVKRKWGFINETGRIAVPADFDAVGSFDNGVADVVYHNISFYVNKQGDILPRIEK